MYNILLVSGVKMTRLLKIITKSILFRKLKNICMYIKK